MNQGFRKGSKIPQILDSTGVTPPTKIDEQRNSKRAQQITHLHQQFQDLKKKIKQVQNKNQKIIQKIHKAYNFKKKNAYTEQYIPIGEQSPVVHYENRYEHGQAYSGAMSVDAHSNKSNQSQKQIKFQKRSSQIPSKKTMKNEKFNYSLQYGKSDVNIGASNDALRQTYTNQSQSRYNQPQMPPMYPQTSPSFTASGPHNNRLQRKLVQQLNQQKQALQQQLSQKEAQIYRVQSLLKNSTKNVKNMLQASLEQFYEQVLQKNLSGIQKAFKKYENKMKSLKKATLSIKDRQEEKKSSRLLEYGRSRRSQSKSRRNSPPRDYNTRDSKINFSRDYKDQSRSRSKIAVQKQQRNKKQFQQIANRYQEIIKNKTQQIQKWDKKYRLKERQCYQLKMRVDVLQKRLAQQENRSSKEESLTSQDVDMVNKKRISTQSDLLADINENRQSIYQQQISKLQSKINELQSISNEKSTQISNLQNMISVNENKNKLLTSEYQQNLKRTKQKYQDDQEKYKFQFDKMIHDKNQQLNVCKLNLSNTQKKFLQKQCQYYTLQSKVKKLQSLLSSKDKKIQQLQKLAGDSYPTDRSGMAISTVFNSSQANNQAIKRLKQQIQSLENKLQENRNQIFTLSKKNNYYKTKTDQLQFANTEIKKQIEALHIQNQQLKINVNMNNISAVMKQDDPQNSRDEEEVVTNSLSVMNQNNRRQSEDIQAVNLKIVQLTKEKQQWYQKYQKIKNQNLQKQSQGIKIKSQLGFAHKQLADSQSLINKIKSQNENLKSQNKQIQDKLNNLQQLLEAQRQDFKSQINDIQRRWEQFEDEMRKSGFHAELQKSQRSSIVSLSHRNNIDYISTQNQYLTVKLKEAEAQIQTQKQMEQKIIDQYQAVMEEYKIEIRNKGDHIKALKQDIQQLNDKIAHLHMRIQVTTRSENQTNSGKNQQKNQLMEKMLQLEAEVKQQKQINNKLTDMEGQLFDQIKIKQQERAQLYEELRKKQARIQQLQQIAQVRGEPANTYASHLSQSTHKRESLKSQSSLKYSSHSQALRKSRMMNSGKGGNNIGDQKIFDLQLSEAGSQFYQQPSQISNISQFFQKQELPYQRIKIKRQEQIKLFQKTASYIKSLKKAIEQKNKKIKLLQKKIQSLKSSQLVRKQIGLDIDIKQDRFLSRNDHLQADDTFKDYESVQLQYKRGGHLRRYKQLEHDTKLVMEENNLLIQQIQTLEQELLKSQQQENSLVKIKDLYKEQIKKLIKKNEEQTKAFEQELRNQKQRVQASQSVHNIQAIKQLFTKIVQITGMKFVEENMNAKKKEEKRKQLEEYIKVMSNILKLDKKAKDALINCLHK